MKAPEGFTTIAKILNRPMPSARIGHTTITLNQAARQALPEFVVVALNGTSFALRAGAEGDYKVAKNGQLSVRKACRTLAHGNYTGTKQGDWWIFSPVEE